MTRRGHDQISVRLPDDVMERLRHKVGEAGRGRAGGVALYVRALIYRDLGIPLPVPTLHEEIAEVLQARGNRISSTREIAQAVNERGLYPRPRAGGPVPPSQIAARVSKHPELFERVDGGVRLID